MVEQHWVCRECDADVDDTGAALRHFKATRHIVDDPEHHVTLYSTDTAPVREGPWPPGGHAPSPDWVEATRQTLRYQPQRLGA